MDPYVSRTGTSERIVPRLDPVIAAQGPRPCGFLPQYAVHYESHGYALIAELFSADEVRRFAGEADLLVRSAMVRRNERAVHEPDSDQLRSIFDVQRFSEVFTGLVEDSRLVDWARFILGEEVYIHQTRLNFKPGFEGKAFYWHSDFETWHVEDGMPRMHALSMSIALADNYTTNGPIMVIPGSHRRYVSCSGTTPEGNYRTSLKNQEYGVPSAEAISRLAADKTIVPVTCKAGDVLIFDCNTMHGSSANITPYPRTNLFVVFNARSNRLHRPYSGQEPRPEWIARRQMGAHSRVLGATDADG